MSDVICCDTFWCRAMAVLRDVMSCRHIAILQCGAALWAWGDVMW